MVISYCRVFPKETTDRFEAKKTYFCDFKSLLWLLHRLFEKDFAMKIFYYFQGLHKPLAPDIYVRLEIKLAL